MNNEKRTEKNADSRDEQFWLSVRSSALALFGAVPEGLRSAPPDASRWLRLRDAAVLAWSALPPEYQGPVEGEVA